jgi:hypothetical protein
MRGQIWEDGFNPRDQSWGVDRLRANAGLVNFTIPACILPGQYLLRHEVIGAPGSACCWPALTRVRQRSTTRRCTPARSSTCRARRSTSSAAEKRSRRRCSSPARTRVRVPRRPVRAHRKLMHGCGSDGPRHYDQHLPDPQKLRYPRPAGVPLLSAWRGEHDGERCQREEV